jgi:hypothetical protein
MLSLTDNRSDTESCCIAPTEKKSCCRRTNRQQNNAPSQSTPQIGSTACHRVLTPPSLLAVNDNHDSEPHAALASAIALLWPLDPVISLSTGEHEVPIDRTHHSPPPQDRIITLCHFVI